MTYVPIVKDILPSIDLILGLSTPGNYTVNLGTHYLNGTKFKVEKSERQYNFEGSSKIQKGIQTHKEIQFSRDEIVELIGSNHSLFVEGKYLLLNNIDYDDDYNKLFSGSINSFSSAASHDGLNNKYLRMIMPDVDKKIFDLYQFKHLYFATPKNSHIDYLPVLFDDSEYHIYKCTSKENAI